MASTRVLPVVLLVILVQLSSGATGRQLPDDDEELPPELVTSERPADEPKATHCKICGENFDLLKGFSMDCWHDFHEHCLRDWILKGDQRGPTGCPVCYGSLLYHGQPINSFFELRDSVAYELKKELWGYIGGVSFE